MKKKIIMGVVLVLILFIVVFSMNYKVELNGISSNVNSSTFAFVIDGQVSDTIPEGNYYLTGYTCQNNSEVSYDRETGKVSIKNITGTTDSCSLELFSEPLLNQMKVGDYVAYVGNNGCNNGVAGTTGTSNAEAGNSCKGENANQSADTSNYTYGYCYLSSHKFYTYGWRIAYIENDTVYLVSAGAPECKTKTSSMGNTTFISEANTAALDYCNSTYAYDGTCNSSSAWAMGNEDFKKITNAISGTSSNLTIAYGSPYCWYGSGQEGCGYNNDLIDNGGFYWFAAYYSTSSSTGVYWNPPRRFVDNIGNAYACGLRPIIRLSSSVFVTGGSGTMNDPFKIGVYTFNINNNSTHTNNRNVTLNLLGSGIDTMCISNTESCTNYEPYTSTKSWTLTSDDGGKTVYVYYKDASGNVLAELSKTITLDTVAPSNNSITISSGGTRTRTLTLLSTGADYMCFSNTSSDSSSCTNWVDYNTTYIWKLSEEFGSKTVYAFFRDKAGNISSAVSATTTVTVESIIEDFSDTTYNSALTISGSVSYPWTVANSRFESTNQGVNSSTSTSTIVFTANDTATLTFDYGVSSESEYDKLTITLTGSDSSSVTIANAISGTKSDSASQPLTAGVTYTLTLSYSKDISSSRGDDIGYIDNLVIE